MIFSALVVFYHYLKPYKIQDELRPKKQFFITLPWHLDLNFHVNNAKYLSYCNRARLIYIADAKILNFFIKERILPVIFKNEIRYFKSLGLFNIFSIETDLHQVTPDSLALKHIFFKKGQQVGEVISYIKLKKKKERINHEELYFKYFKKEHHCYGEK